MRTSTCLAAVLILLAGCAKSPTFTCPDGTNPCGNGCIPNAAVCCNDGTTLTSSYCTESAGCYANDRGCPAVFPMGVKGAFCCGRAGSFGSNDCPAGQRHCGLLCKNESEPCCTGGATCVEMSWDEGGCSQAPAGNIGCGVCTTTSTCRSCPPGSCCMGSVCGGAHQCITGGACTGAPSGGGDSAGNCALYTNRCGQTSGGVAFAGTWVPQSCSCPGGMIDKGGSYSNVLCGLAGGGTGCKFCDCP